MKFKILGDDFDGVFQPGITNLSITGNLKMPLSALPDMLTSLTIGGKFNQPLEKVPKKYKIMKI